VWPLRKQESNYLHPHRLADVLALIQVLAFDPDTHRSESGLLRDLQAHPRSAKSWPILAKDHPEFFRVSDAPDTPVSLLARHVTLRDARSGKHPILKGTHVDSLLKAAIEMHDRQVRRDERWTYLIPIWVALVAGLFALIVELLKHVPGSKS
jgi:hypothetical protein